MTSLVPAYTHAAPDLDDQRAALLPLELEGKLKSAWRTKLQDDIGRGLTQAGLDVVEPADVVEANGGDQTCDDPECYRSLASEVDARFLVRATLSVEERNYDVAIDIIDGRDGSLAASSSESCQLCGLSEVRELVTKQAAALRQKVDMLTLEPAVVTITSEPSDATIWIDGKRVGSTPLEHELEPGTHEAKASRRGYLDQERTITAVQGVRDVLEFELVPVPSDETERRDLKVPIGWALLGVGAGSLVAGATFLAIDENPYQARCSGSDVDALGNCRQRYNTLTHGIALAATGGALAITGAALLIASRVKRGRRASETAQRRLQIGIGTLGGRF